MTARDVDRAVERIARRQHGVVTAAQAASVGATSGLITRRVRAGQWVRLGPRIYAVAGADATWLRALKAAQLSSPGAAISHTSAAALHDLPGFRPGGVHITVPPDGNARNRLAVVHRSPAVPTTRVRGITVVSVAHALFDVAGRVPHRHLESALDHSLLRDLVSIGDLIERRDVLAPGHRLGARAMRTLIEQRTAHGYAPPESELEARLRSVLGDPRLPPVVYQAPLPWRPEGGERVDATIPAWRLIVEADGRRWHARVADFDVDRTRDNEAAAHGYRVQRFTWSHLTADPMDILSLLVAAGRWSVQAA